MSKWTRLSREFLGDGDLKISNDDALHLIDSIEADCAKIARLTRERDELREALTFVKTGPLASMLSAAEDVPKGPRESEATIAVPVDLIRHWNEYVSEALATLDVEEKM